MGCVHSQSSATATGGMKPKETYSQESKTSNRSDSPSKNSIVSKTTHRVPGHDPKVSRKEGWAVRPGYSSGASSFDDSDDDDEEKGGQSTAIRSSSRHGLDRSSHSVKLALGELRETITSNGDICQSVVRIETSFGKPIEEIYDGVHDGPVLGSGVSGIVRLVSHRATGRKYAVKVLDLELIATVEGLKQLRDEIFIMCQLDHPNIVRIDEVYESTNEIYIVQELCLGGDLFDRLDEQEDYHYTEAQCARLVKMMLSSVRYLHSKGIVHRDLKLENFLFSTKSPNSDLKMIDFGLSKHFDLGQVHTEMVGTPYTVAPEIIRGTYDEKCDIWSLGVITYLLLSGETPFGGLDGENMLLVKQNIMRAQVTFKPPDVWTHVSQDGRAFVIKLLQADPVMRPTAKEVQTDEWIRVWAKKDAKEGNILNDKTVSALMAFKESSDMQKILSEVLSFTLLPEQMMDLKSEFEKIDTDGDGEISLTALKSVLLNGAVSGSLGALTEQEIDDIFDAIRVRKSEPTIRWHEFLAAGLSQARVDDRNLRIAFDRLDNDRKGFISFEDLQYLIGGSTEAEELEKIWRDSLLECKSYLNRITFEDFKRLMKGQVKRDHRKPSYHVLSGSLRGAPSLEGEGWNSMMMEPVKEGVSMENEPQMSDDDEDDVNPQRHYAKKRSRSYEGKASMWDQSFSESSGFFVTPDLAKDASRAFLLNATAAENDMHMSARSSTLLVNRSIYRKHRELRLSVLEASKQFDKKRTEIQNQDHLHTQASLIMRRGTKPPVDLEDAHRRALFDAAAKRCGRRRTGRRNKTVSDVTGMLSGR